MSSATDEEFVAFVEASERDLRRTAYLLCSDWQLAEDVVQTALYKVYLAWRRIQHREAVWSYARRAVINAVYSETRRGWRREQPVEQLPDATADDDTDALHDRMLLRLALASLPVRQRAVVVLRFAEDLDVRETAVVLNCPEGTVKSYAARALSSLRVFLVRHGVVRGTAVQETTT